MGQKRTYTLDTLRCDRPGFTSLGNLSTFLIEQPDSTTLIDCALVKWIDANIAAALKAIFDRIEQFGGNIDLVNLRPDVRNVLRRNGFFENDMLADRYKTCIPLRVFETHESVKFSEYSFEHLEKNMELNLSNALKIKFFEGIDEIFQNSVLHCHQPTKIYACGQLYPKRKLIDFTIVDLGKGFRWNVENYLNKEVSGSRSIDWAMSAENTTRDGDVSGGLGLKILLEFIKHNGGKLTIYSDTGYWTNSSNGIELTELTASFPGAVVNLEIRTDDIHHYFLKSEVDPNSVL